MPFDDSCGTRLFCQNSSHTSFRVTHIQTHLCVFVCLLVCVCVLSAFPCVRVGMSVGNCVCACVCVCVHERERQQERVRKRERERER